jgi:hypothetical protein
MTTSVGVEIGAKKVFAWAPAWPGWCRSAKSEHDALDSLAAYAPRYAVVAERAGLRFPKNVADTFDVAERLPGNATTDFGAPGAIGDDDARPLDRRQATRLTELVAAAWVVFDEVSAGAPADLRKGPRGGGRDRDKMIDHVLSTETAYAAKFAVSLTAPAIGDTKAIAAVRQELLDALGEPSDGQPPKPKGWPARYVIRRVAWHALDHAWEMQDRSEPG